MRRKKTKTERLFLAAVFVILATAVAVFIIFFDDEKRPEGKKVVIDKAHFGIYTDSGTQESRIVGEGIYYPHFEEEFSLAVFPKEKQVVKREILLVTEDIEKEYDMRITYRIDWSDRQVLHEMMQRYHFPCIEDVSKMVARNTWLVAVTYTHPHSYAELLQGEWKEKTAKKIKEKFARYGVYVETVSFE